MNEQAQQQIVALVQAAMQGDQQAQQQIQQIMQAAQQGDQQAIQIAQLIQQVVQQMQGQQVQAAKFGAKLNYIKHLRGQCPAGYEMGYYKAGGRLCKTCVRKHYGGAPVGMGRDVKNAIATGKEAIDEFKNKQKSNSRRSGYIPYAKKITPEEAAEIKRRKEDSEQKSPVPYMDKIDHFKEQPKKEKCGGKVKKKAVGGAIDNKELPISCPCQKKKISKKAGGGDFDKYYTSYEIIDPTDYSNSIPNYSPKSKYEYSGPDLSKTRWYPYNTNTSINISIDDMKKALEKAGIDTTGMGRDEIVTNFNISKDWRKYAKMFDVLSDN